MPTQRVRFLKLVTTIVRRTEDFSICLCRMCQKPLTAALELSKSARNGPIYTFLHLTMT
jgi:hypothetical protein